MAIVLKTGNCTIGLSFGSVSVIIFGDFAQIPPVGDKPLYCSSPIGTLSIYGYHHATKSSIDKRDLIQTLPHSVISSLMVPQTLEMLLKRSPQQVNNVDNFTDAIRTKKMLCNTTSINCTVYEHKLPGLMPFIQRMKRPELLLMMLKAYIQSYS